MEPKPQSQGSYFPNNGVQNESAKVCQVNFDGTQGGKLDVGEGECKDLPPEELLAADLSSDVKGSSGDQDPLLESIFALQSAQQLLEKELLMFKDINKDISVDESDIHTEFIDANLNIQQTSSRWLPYSESVLQQSRMDEETELEDFFKQKIEKEVEYVVISRVVQKLKIASRNQITVFLEEQKAMVSEHKQMVDKLQDTENKALMLLKETQKLESVCEDIVVADETRDLQKAVFKYIWCFLLQIVMLSIIVAIFMYRISHTYIRPPPT